jgi:multidrug efflux system outer membrane protein
MLKHSLIAASVALFAAGCTMAPKYERPAEPVSTTFPQGGVYATQPGPVSAERSAHGAAATDIGWRDFFVDERLKQLIEIALKNNRDLRVSVLNIQAARAQYQITRSELFPAIEAAASQSKSRTPKNLSFLNKTISNEYSVGLNASWEIDFFGRIQSLKDQALAQYLATAQARKAAEIALVSSVADQYVSMLGFDEALKVTQNTLRTAQDSYNITKLQYETGTGSELDLRQAETVVEQARANLQTEARARAQAENALVLLVGEPLPADLAPGRSLNDQNLLTDIPAGLPSDLLTRRPDIMEAEQNLLAANANIGAARAAFFPRISLTGNFGTLSPTLGGLFKAGSAAWGFAPQITVPIFEGGANVANLDLAHVQKNIQIAQYEKAIQSAFREVADALAGRANFGEQVDAQARAVAADTQRVKLAQLRYDNGVASYLDLLDAQRTLFADQQVLVQARSAQLQNQVQLYKSLGGGWNPVP